MPSHRLRRGADVLTAEFTYSHRLPRVLCHGRDGVRALHAAPLRRRAI